MSHRSTRLASGAINGADRLIVELVKPPDLPAFVRIVWPHKTTIAQPANYPAMAAAITKIIAESATGLAQIKAWRRLSPCRSARG
jgi:hypothetical protein